MKPIWRVFLLSTLLVAFDMLAANAPRQLGQAFTEPVLVKGSATNLRAFDVSWNATPGKDITLLTGRTTRST